MSEPQDPAVTDTTANPADPTSPMSPMSPLSPLSPGYLTALEPAGLLEAGTPADLAPVEAPPARRRRHPGIRSIAVIATALTMLASGALTAAQWPATPASGAAADFATPDPDSPWLPDYVPDSARYPRAWSSMNEALRANDRERFLSYATGDARTQLELWWDNTALIGRDTAYIVPSLGSGGGEGAFLGAELAFSSRPVRGSGDADAGYRLTEGFGYDITTTGYGDGMRITSFTPVSPMPWDEGRLYVAKRDHVVLYGMADEQALVDANVDTAEKAAVLAITTITDLGGRVPMNGFVSGITADQARMDRWEFGSDVPQGDATIAGYAKATSRPAFRSDLFESDIAVGDATSGVLVMIGPLSADQRLATFTHEFSHGLHYAAAPLTSSDTPPVAAYEGFATYIELRTGITDIRWLQDERVKSLVAEKGVAALSDDAFAGEDAWLSYVAAGSYYLFVAQSGGDPWQLAVNGARAWQKNLIEVENDPRFSEANWKAWLKRR